MSNKKIDWVKIYLKIVEADRLNGVVWLEQKSYCFKYVGFNTKISLFVWESISKKARIFSNVLPPDNVEVILFKDREQFLAHIPSDLNFNT